MSLWQAAYTFIQLPTVQDENGHIIGYHAATNPGQDPYQVPASFPPTSLRLQTYPYLESPTSAPVDGHDSNSIVYCQMVKHETPPAPPNDAYSWSGNFVQPDMHGTMAISRHCIFDFWLLPVLQELNFATFLSCAWCSNSGREGTENWAWGYKAGAEALAHWNDPAATDFTYHGYAWAPKPDGQIGFHWGPDEDRNDSNGGIWGSYVEQYIACKAICL
jgi:hypothetical protein